jgi:predicted NBD/HSP70 family sugar kinase
LNLLPPCGIVKTVTAANTRDAPVRQRSLRTHNLGLVLRLVAGASRPRGADTAGASRPRGADTAGASRPVSRADLAAATGLTRATVSTLVDELLAGGLLAEVEPARRAGAGRPAVGLRLADTGPAGLGLEINVDYLAAVVVDLGGRERHRTVRHDDQRGRPPGAVLDEVAELAGAAAAAVGSDGLEVAGVAVAVPGLVADGVVRLAPHLGWRDLDVRAALRERAARAGPAAAALAGEVSVGNEANLAALAELHTRLDAGAEPDRCSFLYISGEIGVGAGIVLAGQLLRGARGFGGELGHVTVRPDGPRCRCGARGCLETYANQEALLRGAGQSADPAGGGAVDRLVASARAGAGPTRAALAEAGTALGVAVADVVNLLDVGTVVLGGVYAPLAGWLAGPIRREISERVLTAAWAPVSVEASVLGASATVIGAAGSVVRAVRDAPAAWLARSGG